MITFAIFIIVSSIFAVPFIKSPIKMIGILIQARAWIFVCIWMWTSSSWMPIIFFLIFMGGIIILFIMVSSILPNEKSEKIKYIIIFVLPLTFVIELSKTIRVRNLLDFKWFSQMYTNLYFLCLIILLYFFAFIYIISSNFTRINREGCL